MERGRLREELGGKRCAAGKTEHWTRVYGRSFRDAKSLDAPHGGVDDMSWEIDEGSPQYFNIMDQLHLMSVQWDDESKTPYAFFNDRKGGFVSYDDERSICLKTEYAINNSLGGFIIWELSGDVMEDLSTPLLDMVNRKLSEPYTNCADPFGPKLSQLRPMTTTTEPPPVTTTLEIPTGIPTAYPTSNPTAYPTSSPTVYPTSNPTAYPTVYPTTNPPAIPTQEPVPVPTPFPTTEMPTPAPTEILAETPTGIPTAITEFPPLVTTVPPEATTITTEIPPETTTSPIMLSSVTTTVLPDVTTVTTELSSVTASTMSFSDHDKEILVTTELPPMTTAGFVEITTGSTELPPVILNQAINVDQKVEEPENKKENSTKITKEDLEMLGGDQGETFPPGCSWQCFLANHPRLSKRIEHTEEAALDHWINRKKGVTWDCTCKNDTLIKMKKQANLEKGIDEIVETEEDMEKGIKNNRGNNADTGKVKGQTSSKPADKIIAVAGDNSEKNKKKNQEKNKKTNQEKNKKKNQEKNKKKNQEKNKKTNQEKNKKMNVTGVTRGRV